PRMPARRATTPPPRHHPRRPTPPQPQHPPQTNPPAPQTPAPQGTAPSTDKTITITGCLKEAPSSGPASSAAAPPATPPAAAGSAGDTAATPNYILTNATTATGSDSATGTTGTAGTTAGSTAGTTGRPADKGSSGGQTYKLIANPTALTPHVGKKLELTGTLESQSGAAPASPSTTASDANPLRNAPTLRVTGGKIIAPSCQE